jgi:hypothetical protein
VVNPIIPPEQFWFNQLNILVQDSKKIVGENLFEVVVFEFRRFGHVFCNLLDFHRERIVRMIGAE